MGRFSVEKNMVPQTAPNQNNQTLAPVQYAPLQMPTSFDKFVVALDRDGVLCECGDSITGPEAFRPITDSFRAVAVIRSKGHKVVILFDQPSISQKKVTIEQVEDCNRHMLNLLGQAGCTSIDGIWYNTSNKKEDIYGKPKLGLFKHAENNVPNLKMQGGVYVGDTIDDLIMADRAGATPVLVLTGQGRRTAEQLQKPIYKMLAPKVRIYDNLMKFAETL